MLLAREAAPPVPAPVPAPVVPVPVPAAALPVPAPVPAAASVPAAQAAASTGGSVEARSGGYVVGAEPPTHEGRVGTTKSKKRLASDVSTSGGASTEPPTHEGRSPKCVGGGPSMDVCGSTTRLQPVRGLLQQLGVAKNIQYAAELPEDRFRPMGGESGLAVSRGLRNGTGPVPLPMEPSLSSRRTIRCGHCGGEGHSRRTCTEGSYTVSRIINHRGEGTSMEFLVQWVGYTNESNTWEPTSNLSGVTTWREYMREHEMGHLIPNDSEEDN